jgi:hypothetical protein
VEAADKRCTDEGEAVIQTVKRKLAEAAAKTNNLERANEALRHELAVVQQESADALTAAGHSIGQLQRQLKVEKAERAAAQAEAAAAKADLAQMRHELAWSRQPQPASNIVMGYPHTSCAPRVQLPTAVPPPRRSRHGAVPR